MQCCHMFIEVKCKRVFSWRCCTWHSNNCKLDYNKPTKVLLHQPVKDTVKSNAFFLLVENFQRKLSKKCCVQKEEFIFALKKLGITIVKTF
jgi:hypothetical protein